MENKVGEVVFSCFTDDYEPAEYEPGGLSDGVVVLTTDIIDHEGKGIPYGTAGLLYGTQWLPWPNMESELTKLSKLYVSELNEAEKALYGREVAMVMFSDNRTAYIEFSHLRPASDIEAAVLAAEVEVNMYNNSQNAENVNE